MPFLKHDRITPAQVVILGFLFQILIGACLLSLPVATRSGERVPFLDALFTATSATCVTGLVIHDTALFWSPFGQGVILLLIQVGGMGVVTMAVAIFMFSGRKIGLKQRWVMQEHNAVPVTGQQIRDPVFLIAKDCFFRITAFVVFYKHSSVLLYICMIIYKDNSQFFTIIILS